MGGLRRVPPAAAELRLFRTGRTRHAFNLLFPDKAWLLRFVATVATTMATTSTAATARRLDHRCQGTPEVTGLASLSYGWSSYL